MSSVAIVSRQLLELLKNKPKLKELVKEKKFNIDSLISDLKLEQGDRGKAEEVPKKKFDKNVSKQKDIPTAPDVPTKTREPMLFANAKFREVHCGHLHKEMVNEYRGVKVRFIPSNCSNDAWHKMMGYEAKRTGQAHIWSKTRGYEGYLQTNI